jgi:hypothetical protein
MKRGPALPPAPFSAIFGGSPAFEAERATADQGDPLIMPDLDAADTGLRNAQASNSGPQITPEGLHRASLSPPVRLAPRLPSIKEIIGRAAQTGGNTAVFLDEGRDRRPECFQLCYRLAGTIRWEEIATFPQA